MISPRLPVVSRAPHAAWPAALTVGLLLALSANEACAAALGSLTTSVGLFAALAALFVIKGWPAHLPVASALSTAGGALVVAGGAAWWWRTRLGARSMSFAPASDAPRRRMRPALASAPRAEPIALPFDIDREALLRELRWHFVRLQEAWDVGAVPALQALTTPDMLAELCGGLPGCAADAPARTDVVTLTAELFGFDEVGDTLLVSVEFSGLMRESVGEGASPFRELWLLTRPKLGAGGWKLARHQALI